MGEEFLYNTHYYFDCNIMQSKLYHHQILLSINLNLAYIFIIRVPKAVYMNDLQYRPHVSLSKFEMQFRSPAHTTNIFIKLNSIHCVRNV